jgi:hypothetical protein
VLSLTAIILIAHRKRKSLKVAAIVFALAGIVMVCTKLLADQTFNDVEKHIFNSSTVGQLQKALTVFLHHVENQIVKVDLWFGIAYLVIALLLVLTLVITRQRGLRIPKPLQNLMPSDGDNNSGPVENTSEPEPETRPPAAPRPAPKPRRPKPPRLVQ